MSRSRKKTPVLTFVCCKSQKEGKTRASRLFRRISRMKLKGGDDCLPIKSRELIDPWDLGGDGKRYWDELEEKHLRK